MEKLKQIFLSSFMVTDLLTLKNDETLWNAYHRMRLHRIRHLPVVNDKGELIGMFTDKDLTRAYSPKETDAGWYYDRDELGILKPVHFMTENPTTLTPSHTLQDAAEIMARNRFGSIPIVEQENSKILVGIITQVDIFREIVNLFE